MVKILLEHGKVGFRGCVSRKGNKFSAYFYYEKDRVTILDYEFLTSVHKKEQAYVMYADSCALSDSDLQKWNITFKKIPRDIEHI